MNFGNEVRIKLENLIDFIYCSKRTGFAATDKKTSLSDGSSVYSNRELPWLYTDIYCGNTVERGCEDVYFDMVLIWSMQYRGGMLKEYYEIAGAVSVFLKLALMELPKDFPIRGPEIFKHSTVELEDKIYKGDFIYKNQWTGDIRRFTGYEEILWDGRVVYYHDYIGGLVRNKYFPTVVV